MSKFSTSMGLKPNRKRRVESGAFYRLHLMRSEKALLDIHHNIETELKTAASRILEAKEHVVLTRLARWGEISYRITTRWDGNRFESARVIVEPEGDPLSLLDNDELTSLLEFANVSADLVVGLADFLKVHGLYGIVSENADEVMILRTTVDGFLHVPANVVPPHSEYVFIRELAPGWYAFHFRDVGPGFF